MAKLSVDGYFSPPIIQHEEHHKCIPGDKYEPAQHCLLPPVWDDSKTLYRRSREKMSLAAVLMEWDPEHCGANPGTGLTTPPPN